ncbi:MAG: hypothetical protein MJK13_00015 [Pseudomonadales bacterium]|nr:hypothetical protein [Pseudomonadales bacterium]
MSQFIQAGSCKEADDAYWKSIEIYTLDTEQKIDTETASNLWNKFWKWREQRNGKRVLARVASLLAKLAQNEKKQGHNREPSIIK